MLGTHHEDARAAPLSGASRTRYLVMRRGDAWIIEFGGEEFGPYKSDREAILFAVDAANKLGQQDAPTEVLRMDESGETKPVWVYGEHPYPPAV